MHQRAGNTARFTNLIDIMAVSDNDSIQNVQLADYGARIKSLEEWRVETQPVISRMLEAQAASAEQIRSQSKITWYLMTTAFATLLAIVAKLIFQ